MSINISTSSAIFRWRPTCWLRVSGEDAASFLQGQFTNDLRGLAQERAVYGLWLNVKGKVLADSFVLRESENSEFWIGSYFSPATVVRERLESHVIADDVTIEDVTDAWAGVSVLGEAAGELLRHPSNAGSGFVFRGRRERGGSIECVYPIAAGEPAWLAAVASATGEISIEEMARRRVATGIPAIPADVGSGDLPNEAALEGDAISYTKGCYLGQEVMARLKSMGQVRRLSILGKWRNLFVSRPLHRTPGRGHGTVGSPPEPQDQEGRRSGEAAAR